MPPRKIRSEIESVAQEVANQ